jgi:hypothetical protein
MGTVVRGYWENTFGLAAPTTMTAQMKGSFVTISWPNTLSHLYGNMLLLVSQVSGRFCADVFLR